MSIKVLFDITTPYQLLTAIVTSYNYDSKKYYKIALLNNTLFEDVNNLKLNLLKTSFFDEVHIINELDKVENIILQIESLNLLETTDIYHFSSYSSCFSCYIFNHLHKNAQINLNEEGLASYRLVENYEKYLNISRNNKAEIIDLQRIQNIYLYNKELWQSKSIANLINIDVSPFYDDLNLLKQLNLVFSYEYDYIKEKNIFFTQNFIDYNIVKLEELENFYTKLFNSLEGDIVFNLHPFDKLSNLYSKIGIKVLKHVNQVPWELILLNHILFNKSISKNLISVGSTSLYSEILFFNGLKKKLNLSKIYLYNLIEIPFNITTKQNNNYIQKKLDFNFFTPKSFNELKLN